MTNSAPSFTVPLIARCPRCQRELLSADLPVDLVRRPIEPAAATRLLNMRDVADRLGISRSTVYALVGRGELRVIRIGRRVLVPAPELKRFIQDGQL